MGFGELLGHAVGLDDHIRTIGEGYAVLLSTVSVVVGWIVTSRRAINQHRRENAHTYIIEKDPQRRDTFSSIPYFRTRTLVPDYSETDPDPIQSSVIRVLNELEYMANDIKHGHVFEHHIANAQGRLVCNAFRTSRRLIATVRSTRKTPTTYTNLETLYIRWEYPGASSFTRVFEWALNRPIFPLTRMNFTMKYALCRHFFDLDKDFLLEKPENVQTAFRRFNLIFRWVLAYALFASLLVLFSKYGLPFESS